MQIEIIVIKGLSSGGGRSWGHSSACRRSRGIVIIVIRLGRVLCVLLSFRLVLIVIETVVEGIDSRTGRDCRTGRGWRKSGVVVIVGIISDWRIIILMVILGIIVNWGLRGGGCGRRGCGCGCSVGRRKTGQV